MPLIDSHCHLNYKGIIQQQAQVIERAQKNNITKLINICTNIDEASDIIETAEKYPSVYASVGIHPHDSEKDLKAYEISKLHEQLLRYSSHPKVVGLGETGLDYFYNNSDKKKQQQSFEMHISIAKETKLPLIIHTRSAPQDTIALLKSELNNITGVIHCFSESEEFAKQALDLGFYISISGIATFKNSADLRKAIKSIPLNRLLLETDSPFLAPTPFRGKPNEPSYMIETAKLLSDIKEVSLSEISTITTNNCLNLFTKMKK